MVNPLDCAGEVNAQQGPHFAFRLVVVRHSVGPHCRARGSEFCVRAWEGSELLERRPRTVGGSPQHGPRSRSLPSELGHDECRPGERRPFAPPADLNIPVAS